MTISNNNFSINETLNDNITTLNKSSLDIQKLYPQSSINFKDSGGTSNLFIDQTGNVGIGTSDPVSKLDLNGDIRLGNKNILMENEIKSISCGGAHTAILTEDGKVLTFGDNEFGQLGINSIENQNIDDLPMEISGNHTDIIAVS